MKLRLTIQPAFKEDYMDHKENAFREIGIALVIELNQVVNLKKSGSFLTFYLIRVLQRDIIQERRCLL